MCEPISMSTMAWIALGTTAAGYAVQAYNQHEQGQYEQDVANYNAKVGEQQAKQVEEIGNIQEQQQRTKVRQMIGAQRAAMAASGATVDEGTFGNLLDDTYMAGEMDAQNIRANAMKEAWGYRVGADMTRRQGQAAAAAGNAAAFGTLLTGAGQTFGMMSKAKTATSGTPRV